MSSPSAKRSLFSAASPRKRAKTKTVVVRAKGESKYDDQVYSLSSGTGDVSRSLLTSLFQGDGQGQRIGSKLRISNLEIRWDLTKSTTRDFSAVIRLVIPKDPSTTVPAYDPVAVGYYDPTQFTVLHEIYLTPGNNMAGMYRWKGPLNVQFSGDSTTCLKNNIHIACSSASNASLTNAIQTRMWYTDN